MTMASYAMVNGMKAKQNFRRMKITERIQSPIHSGSFSNIHEIQL